MNLARNTNATANKRAGHTQQTTALLTGAEEINLARAIRHSDEETWTELLSFAPATLWCLAQLEARLDEAPDDFRKVRRAATRYLKNRDERSFELLYKHAAACAKNIRSLDLDRIHLGATWQELSRFRSVETQGLPFNTTAEAFDAYRQRVQHAMKESAGHRETFIKANFGLIVSVAKRYHRNTLDFQDLIQEGQLGLIKAVDRFDPERGHRFSTYATWWIRHAVGRSISDKSRLVRVPVHLLEAQQKINRVIREMTQDLERPPTAQELAEATELSVAKVRDARIHTLGYVDSLDAPLHGADSFQSRGETFLAPEDDSTEFVESLEQKSVMKKVESVMRYLKPVELDVLRQRFGLDGGDGATLQEIANGFGLSRERVRQIQNKALSKVRNGLGAEMAA